jgi:hypothetical protein
MYQHPLLQQQQYYPPPGYAPRPGQYQQTVYQPFHQQQAPSSSTQLPSAAQIKRKKKKNMQQNIPVQPPAVIPQVQVPFLQPNAPVPVNMAGQASVPAVSLPLPSSAQTVLPVETVSEAPKKPAKCWKCVVDSHTAKECKVHHHCLGLDNLFQHSPYVFDLWPIVTCFGEPQYISF